MDRSIEKYLLPVNWTTATAYYTAFLLFTLINFKEFKMLLPDLQLTPHVSFKLATSDDLLNRSSQIQN